MPVITGEAGDPSAKHRVLISTPLFCIACATCVIPLDKSMGQPDDQSADHGGQGIAGVGRTSSLLLCGGYLGKL